MKSAHHVNGVVIDHDQDLLWSEAKNLGFTSPPDSITNDEQACSWLLENQKDWDIAFVHIIEPEWKELIGQAWPDKLLVRFSSEGFAPGQLEKEVPICLRCLKKTTDLKSMEERNDLQTFISALTCRDDVAAIRNGLVPESLTGLCSFREPHRLRSLEIILSGVLVAWSVGTTDPARRAREVLGLSNARLTPPADFCSRVSLLRNLGLQDTSCTALECFLSELKADLSAEVGCEDYTECRELGSKLDELVEWLANGRCKAEIPQNIAIGTFTAIRAWLSTT